MATKNPASQAVPSSPAEESARPILSVVIPAWFSSWSLPQTLESLKPSPIPLDVVVVENGSRELSVEEMKTHTGKHRVRLIQREVADLSSARNEGLRHAQGEWVLFLDSDDLIDTPRVVSLLRDPTLAKVDVVSLGKEEFQEKETFASSLLDQALRRAERAQEAPYSIVPSDTYLLGQLASRSYSPVTGSFIFRRSLLANLGASFSEGFLHEDHAFVAGVIARSSLVAKTSKSLFFKRLVPSSLSNIITQEESLNGYRQALDDLSKTAATLQPNKWGFRLALTWILARLGVIVTRRSLALRKQGTLPLLRGSFHLAWRTAKFVAVSAVGAVFLMFLRVAR